MGQAMCKQVLIADDSEGVAELMAELLSLSVTGPISTSVAHDGAEAVAQAAAHPPAVVVLDLDMPVMGGIAAALALRQASPDAPPPLLIAVTGNALWAQHQRARAVFDHVLSKPPDIDALVRLIDGAPMQATANGAADGRPCKP